MEEKIKLLSIGKKKAKAENLKSWAKVVERYAPDMYELFYGTGEKDALKKVDELRPEIVLRLPSILKNDLMNSLGLLDKIRQVHPLAAVFVNLGMIDDEQQAFDACMACGACKCYSAPMSMEPLFHDMYVALHIE